MTLFDVQTLTMRGTNIDDRWYMIGGSLRLNEQQNVVWVSVISLIIKTENLQYLQAGVGCPVGVGWPSWPLIFQFIYFFLITQNYINYKY